VNEIGPLLAFVVTALVIEITPGPNMTYLAALSLSSGARTGFAAVAGIALGLMTYGLIATFGLTTIIDKSPVLYGLLRWGGVLYLLGTHGPSAMRPLRMRSTSGHGRRFDAA
jgi:threonine/homoserine/homoserine lactone efflux protein